MRANRNGPNLNERATRWVATYNNPPDDWDRMFPNERLLEKIAYAVVGREVAPTTNTPHLHIYIRLKQKEY